LPPQINQTVKEINTRKRVVLSGYLSLLNVARKMGQRGERKAFISNSKECKNN